MGTIKNLFIMLVGVGVLIQPTSIQAITSAQADSAIEAFNAVYWNESNNTFYKYSDKTGLLDFWLYAHAWETEMDAYEWTRDPMYLNFVNDAYEGFVNRQGIDWSHNDYNDDIAWWILACTRAYQLTQDTAYRYAAKLNLDWLYETQCDDVLGGGIWWKNNTHNEKNACINFPAVCGAINLARITGDRTYLDKALEIYEWGRETLWNEGRVYDNIKLDGRVGTYCSTYNQGTFIGSAFGLFQETGDSTYLRDAILTADYTRRNLCNSEGILNSEGSSNDICAFKTVFIHHMMRFIKEGNQTQYLDWMTENANTVWANRRRSDNLMWYDWTRVPGSDRIPAQAADGGVALLNMLAPQATGIQVVSRPQVVNAQPVIICKRRKFLVINLDRNVPARITMVTMNGRIIKSSTVLGSSHHSVQVPDCAAGIYTIMVAHGLYVVKDKLLISR